MEIFTIVAPVVAGRDSELEALLEAIDPAALFGHIPTLHFASFIVFRGAGAQGESLLVFEINVDGRRDDFIAAVERLPRIDEIYRRCVGYPAPGYLKSKVRLPQLFHVGTPYSTAASIKRDSELRGRLEREIFDRSELLKLVERAAAGELEYWTWELLQPWAALATALFVPVAAPWSFQWLLRHGADWQSDKFAAVVLFTLWAIATIAAVVGGARLWTASLPELRARTKVWIPWVIAGALLAAAPGRAWISPRASTWLGAAFSTLLLFNAGAAVLRRRNERLADIRPDDAERSIVTTWRRLLEATVHHEPRPPWWRRLWNWKWWAILYGAVWAGLSAADRAGGTRLVVGAITLLYFAKAVWLSVLVGWPAGKRWLGWSGTLAAFIGGVPVVALLVATALVSLNTPRWALAALVIATLLALWGVPLPSPAVAHPTLRRADAAKLADLEDRDVQNHMAALVLLKRGRGGWRALVLKSLLALLNVVFFRAWLPDVCKGKLFKLPTVHACQWILLDDRNYLFLSNYDHSWTTYLDDFGIELNVGISKIWGQGDGNPGTRNLERFKQYARSTMVPHRLWYQAYPGLTVRQIWNNENIRTALAAHTDEEVIVRTLRRFGAAPRIPSDLVAHARVN